VGLQVTDNLGATNAEFSTVTVLPATDSSCNQPPVATDISYTTDEDTALSGNVVADDSGSDGETLTASVVSNVSSGSLTISSDGSFTYMPNAEFCGTDSFSYKVNDGTADSNVATVTIIVRCVNDPPNANDDSNSTLEDSPVNGSVAGNDFDNDSSLTFTVAAGPSRGTVVMNSNGSYTYTPTANVCGTDSFTYTASDGTLSDTATVTITVTCVNDAPVCTAAAASQTLLWPPNHQLETINVLGVTDPVEGTATTITITSIWQDEPINAEGDGNTAIDGFGVGTSTAQVRSERSGNKRVPGDGRAYYIFFTGTDAGGATCTGSVKVGVPHDQGNGNTVVEGGPLYKSTGS
jgi:VCBS repeat-containing protein